jgi:hypothetical protein
MVGLEKIIRPFETRSVSPINIPSTGTPPENVVLIYGQNSSRGGGGSSSRAPVSIPVAVNAPTGGTTTVTTTSTAGASELPVVGHYSMSVTCYMTKQEREKGKGNDPLGLAGFKPDTAFKTQPI